MPIDFPRRKVFLVTDDRPEILRSEPRVAIRIINGLALVQVEPSSVRTVLKVVRFFRQRRHHQLLPMGVLSQQDRTKRLHLPADPRSKVGATYR